MSDCKSEDMITAVKEIFSQSPVIRETYLTARDQTTKMEIIRGLISTIKDNDLLDHYLEMARRRSSNYASASLR